MTNEDTRKWFDCAPARKTKKDAEAALEYCISDETDRDTNYRVKKRGSRWYIQRAATA